MSQRDREFRRSQSKFVATSWESLEDRQLFSAGSAANELALIAKEIAAMQAALVAKPTTTVAAQTLVSPSTISYTLPTPTYTTTIVSSAGVVASSSTSTHPLATATTVGIAEPQTVTSPTNTAALPFQFLTTGSLNINETGTLRTAINNFSTAYTFGKNPAADQAAVAAFETQINSVAEAEWAATHSVSTAQINSLQQAVNSFTASYISSTNPTSDAAAWASLQTALNAFYGPASTSTPSTPNSVILSPLFQGNPLTANEMSLLRNAFTVFLSTYSNGMNKTSDATAVATFRTATRFA